MNKGVLIKKIGKEISIEFEVFTTNKQAEQEKQQEEEKKQKEKMLEKQNSMKNQINMMQPNPDQGHHQSAQYHAN